MPEVGGTTDLTKTSSETRSAISDTVRWTTRGNGQHLIAARVVRGIVRMMWMVWMVGKGRVGRGVRAS